MLLPLPRARDLCLAVLGAAVLTADGLTRQSAPAVVIVPVAVAACLPLAWRTRAPLPALLGSAVGLVACLALFHPYDTSIVIAMVGLFTVALRGDRRRSLLVGAGTAVFLAVVIASASADDSSSDVLTELGVRLLLAFGALAAGDVLRSREELRAAERDRELRIAREREQDGARRVTEERLRIARDLHDTVAHALVAINVRAGVAAHLGSGVDSDAVLTDIMDVSTAALNDLRTTLSLLREDGEPAPTAPALDLAAVSHLIDQARAAGLRADADLRLDGHMLPSSVQQAGFRIVQEALTNVLRHASASNATVVLGVERDTLHIDVTDDGVGAASAPGGATRHGLRGMYERAAALGGDVSAGPASHGGWQVHARLPLSAGDRP